MFQGHYDDRVHAGRVLGEHLRMFAGRDVVVLGLPRGGVPVASEVAGLLAAELDVLVVRKLGVPGHEELAMGAVASGGEYILNTDVIEQLALPDDEVKRVLAEQADEVAQRERMYRAGDHQSRVLRNRIVILVDDGLATGATMRAAVHLLNQMPPERAPRQIIVAVPVAPQETLQIIRAEVDDVVCPNPVASGRFGGVGRWYVDFAQVTDSQVREALRRIPPVDI